MRHLVGEAKRAHPRLGEAPTAPPGVSDGKSHAAVSQPSAVTLVVVLETPGSVQLSHQRQLSPLLSTRVFSLLERERPRHEEDGACERRRSDCCYAHKHDAETL